jgi:hypothetical protein
MSYQDYDFAKHQGITTAASRALRKRFSSWSELASALPEQLVEVPGIVMVMVDDLRETAIAQGQLETRRSVRGEEKVVLSGVDSQERLYVLSEKPADAVGSDGAATIRNIKRRRKLLVPSICPECGVDFAERKGLSWETAGPATRDEIVEVVRKHKEKTHDAATKRILTESQMKQIGISAAA